MKFSASEQSSAKLRISCANYDTSVLEKAMTKYLLISYVRLQDLQKHLVFVAASSQEKVQLLTADSLYSTRPEIGNPDCFHH